MSVQRPDASVVASYRRWAELGRQVRRGERALRVWAPSTRRVRDRASGEEAEVVQTWVLVPVFDVSQTDGPPLPEPVRPAPLSGSSHAHLLRDLERGAREAGYAVEGRHEIPAGTEGYVDHARRVIVLAETLSPNGRVAVLVHELAHVHGARYGDFGRAEAEVVAETAAFVVLSGTGLDTGRQSVPYVAGWADAAPKQMAAYAEAVHRIAVLLERDLGLARALDESGVSPARPDEPRAAMTTMATPPSGREPNGLSRIRETGWLPMNASTPSGATPHPESRSANPTARPAAYDTAFAIRRRGSTGVTAAPGPPTRPSRSSGTTSGSGLQSRPTRRSSGRSSPNSGTGGA